MAFYIGDIPAEDIVIEPARELEEFNEATATLATPGGTIVPLDFFASVVEDQVVIEWPDSSPFSTAGVYLLNVVLESSTTSRRERLAPVRLVVQQDDGWHTIDSAREAEWGADAPDQDGDVFELLELAKEAVLAYAEDLWPGARPPLAYRAAQLMQAENVWNASRVNPVSGGDGDGTFVLRPFPLDWQIKQILRPKRGVPVIAT